MDCIFCKIINGDIPSKRVYEDDICIAINDIQPKAPVHVLLIPKTHNITCADDVTEENSAVIAHIFTVIPKIAAQLGISGGYRVVNNCGEKAGQTVHHLHFHILGGKRLSDDMA